MDRRQYITEFLIENGFTLHRRRHMPDRFVKDDDEYFLPLGEPSLDTIEQYDELEKQLWHDFDLYATFAEWQNQQDSKQVADLALAQLAQFVQHVANTRLQAIQLEVRRHEQALGALRDEERNLAAAVRQYHELSQFVEDVDDE